MQTIASGFAPGKSRERFGERLSEYRGCPPGLKDTSVIARISFQVDRGQLWLMPLSLHEWLPEDHLVWTGLGAVEAMNLDRFTESYRLQSEIHATRPNGGAV